jgi:hypothetical protein
MEKSKTLLDQMMTDGFGKLKEAQQREEWQHLNKLRLIDLNLREEDITRRSYLFSKRNAN